jgi:outer membrane lipoprotein-sorting protein
MSHRAVFLLMGIALLLIPGVVRADENLTGTTMRIQQELFLGDLSTQADFQACFVGVDQFRVEGVTRLKEMEMDIPTTVVSDGTTVRQLSTVAGAPQAVTVDLGRIRAALPELDYSPSKTYNPLAYSDLLKENREKVSLGKVEIDGVETEGWELPLDKGRNSLPSNVPLPLPDPAKLRIWLGARDGIARRVEMENGEGQVILRMSYSDIKQAVSLPKSVLELAWPQGVEPTDITEIVLGGIASTRAEMEKPAAAPETAPQEATP